MGFSLLADQQGRATASRQFGETTVEVENNGLGIGWLWRCPPRFPEWSKRGHTAQADAYQAARFSLYSEE